MPEEKPILIVEDNETIRANLAEILESDGEFAVTAVGTVAGAQNVFRDSARTDAVILDVGLPDGDGRGLCLWMRQQGYRMPVIMVTGLSDESDVVRGLDAGANDYIVKPVRAGELIARLRAHLRYFENSEDAVVEIGRWSFQPATRQLWETGTKKRSIRLTSKEAAVLRTLHRSQGRSVDPQRLLREIWEYNPDVNTHTLETHIYRLRQKIESDPRFPTLLLTDAEGYRLMIETEEENATGRWRLRENSRAKL